MYHGNTVSLIYTRGPEEPTTLDPMEIPEESSSPENPVAVQMWAATLTIENMEFTPALTNSSSETFKELASNLEAFLGDVFETIAGFLYVEVESFERGSVICNFVIYAKAESSATATAFETALISAVNAGKTGNYQITKVEVEVNDNVRAVKRDKPPDMRFHPLKVIGVAIFAGGVALIIVLLLCKV